MPGEEDAIAGGDFAGFEEGDVADDEVLKRGEEEAYISMSPEDKA